jgi:hypothetical protein
VENILDGADEIGEGAVKFARWSETANAQTVIILMD